VLYFFDLFYSIMVEYFKRSLDELTNKVTWPTWPELQKTTVVVIAGSVFLACLIAFMDVLWIKALSFLY
jgi:preprotein translocase subunit SecE